MEETKQYWMCIIGGVPKDKIPNGGDFPLRMAVRDTFIQMFKQDCDVCASGWGIDEERYSLLRTLHLLPTDKLKELIGK